VNECRRCGAALVRGQEYCLECGARLLGSGALGRAGDAGRGWILRASLALGVALAGAALAVAATDGGNDVAKLVTATGGFATLPESTTLPAPEEGQSRGIVEWPAGEDGWTIALASVPQTRGRRVAVARAVQARKRGIAAVGILDSSQYASLHPGYWVVFAGVYASEAEATSELQPARRFARTASVRRIVP
jgi:hypothetical protein